MPSAACLAGHHQPETMPSYEWQQLQRFFNRQGASGMSNEQRCSLTIERATLAAMRSCAEWEPEAFPLVASFLDKPLVPLGLLPPSPDGGRRRRGTTTNPNGGGEEEDNAVVRWLDAQPAGSVVYVALGSEVPLRVQQVHELALGLELAGARFLWALRKPSGIPEADILPSGFRERTAGRGHVAMGWVPQVSVLAHAAVGAFLTHAGWNSLIEGLLFGHPLVMLPIYGDQGPNARLMEGRKVGLQVARDEDNGSFNREGVARAVRAVMLEEETRRVLVENARKLQEMVADKELQERYIDGFVEKLRSYTSSDGKDSTSV